MRLLVATLCLLIAAPSFAGVPAAEQNISRAVLVTGASSGIGRKITERLAAQDYFVYATARKDEDLKALGAIRNVQALRLDVTRSADIAAAVETISKAARGLYGLVNNAGAGTIGTIAEMSFEELDLCMKVNVYGPVLMIKAFQPLVIAAQGRIVNIGSVSGVLARAARSACASSSRRRPARARPHSGVSDSAQRGPAQPRLQRRPQLNEGQRYTLDRAALIKMLDEALATARPRTN